MLPLTLEEKLAPRAAALVVIDMQNDFCAPGGYIDQVMKKDVASAGAVAQAIDGLLAAARTAGVPVVWLRADYSHERIPDSMRAKLAARGITAVCCAPGTWGADWYGVKPLEGEAVITKHTYSGFAGTDLAARLQALGRRTLVFTGVQTQVCVESTLRDAHSLGYFCVVPRDAVGSHTPALHEASLDNVRFLFGDVCTAAEVRAAWTRL
ncbi:MAG TPA: isochorismatase family cysteine hydrolase [Burkholderiales bacterium]|nr:isochorismatase family cysteine hydrolase [Burkholderiales bacterium]